MGCRCRDDHALARHAALSASNQVWPQAHASDHATWKASGRAERAAKQAGGGPRTGDFHPRRGNRRDRSEWKSRLRRTVLRRPRSAHRRTRSDGRAQGNRKVSLKLSGLVNTGVIGWDDGGERNAYVVTNDNQRSRFSFVGKAAIDAMWEAGYAIDIGIRARQLQARQPDRRRRRRQPAPTASTCAAPSGSCATSATAPCSSAPPSPPPTASPTPTSRRRRSSTSTRRPRTSASACSCAPPCDGRLTRSLLNWRRIIGAGGDQPGESQRGFSL